MGQAARQYLTPNECSFEESGIALEERCPLPPGWEWGSPNGVESLPFDAYAYLVAWATEINRIPNADPMLWMQLSARLLQLSR